MEIELQKQDYEVKQVRIIPFFFQRLNNQIERSGNMPFILAFCLIGYLGIGFFLGDTGTLLWGALVTNSTRFDNFRFVTSIFLHANFLHILVNLLSLFALSKQLQYIWSRPQVFLVFFVSGVLANYLAYFFYNFMGLSISAIGASGGLFGLLGAMVAFFLFHKEFGPAQRAAYIRQLFPILLLNLLLGLFVPNIALMVHIFGLLVGILCGWILEKLPFNFVKHRPYIWSFLFVLSVLYILFCFSAATYNFIKLTSNLPAY